MQIKRAATQLEALGNPTRLQVYRSLVRAGDAGLPVGQVQERIGIAASTLSHHLRRLILTCRANYTVMRSLLGFLADECCVEESCGAEADHKAA